MQTIKESPILSTTNSKGGTKYWQISIVYDDINYYLVQTYWQTTKEGLSKRQSSDPRMVVGKNLGKSNETAADVQAYLEMQSIINKQKDKGYREEGEEAKLLPLPMLAHDFNKRGKKITYSCYTQPKLDGIRLLFNGSQGWSRQGKYFIPEVIQHLQFDTNLIYDGELILPPPYSFQDTVSAIKKYNPEVSPLLEYHIYDLVVENVTFKERLHLLRSLFLSKDMPANVKLVSTNEINSREDIDYIHAKYIEQGYEGTIIRTMDGLYKVDHRSPDLLKYKDFIDQEFFILDVIDSIGEPGRAIFVCASSTGKYFNVRPKGTQEQRQEWYKDKDKLINRLLTVRYQNLSDDDKVPRFPVGIGIREDWD